MTKDFKNSGLISQVAEFIDKKRIEEGISIDTLCQSAHISKRIYIDLKGAEAGNDAPLVLPPRKCPQPAHGRRKIQGNMVGNRENND